MNGNDSTVYRYIKRFIITNCINVKVLKCVLETYCVFKNDYLTIAKNYELIFNLIMNLILLNTFIKNGQFKYKSIKMHFASKTHFSNLSYKEFLGFCTYF